MNKYFDISRFWLLLKLELFNSRKAVLITFDILFGMLFFLGFLLAIAVEPGTIRYEHHENYAFTLLAGGFILSSLAFHNLSDSLKRPGYLTLPVSTLERMIVMWSLTTFGWVVLFSMTFYLFTILVNPLGRSLFNYVEFVPFDPFGPFALQVVKYYFILQGIFLVGAAHFKSYVFPKTIFVMILFAALCGALFFLFIPEIFDPESNADVCLSEADFLQGKPSFTFWELVVSLFTWGLAPACWVIAYLGLKDQEV